LTDGSLQAPASFAPTARTRTQTRWPDVSVSFNRHFDFVLVNLSAQFVGGVLVS